MLTHVAARDMFARNRCRTGLVYEGRKRQRVYSAGAGQSEDDRPDGNNKAATAPLARHEEVRR
jgi:hypothetical protein